MMWLEFYSATGATPQTATISYTNSGGTAGRSTTVPVPASPVAGRMIPIPLAAGDVGVQSVQTLTLGGSTGTAGNFGITLCYELFQVPVMIAGGGQVLDYAQLGLPIVQTNGTPSNACLAVRVLCSAATTGIVNTELVLAQG